MIRINLLAVERKPVAAKFDVTQKVTLLCSLLLVGTALLVGWRYWSLQQDSRLLDADIATARAETERLQSVLQQVADFERQRVQLQQRVALIEELRKGQSGPVHLLDEVSRALPDRLWLTQMQNQESGDVRVEGRTTSLTALSDFVGNLEASGYFIRPVEIIDSQVETQRDAAAGTASDVVTFTVRAQFAVPGVTPKAEAPEPKAAPRATSAKAAK
ncbi:MAG: PilN domain-containing protein [Vicinamibacterales bacterium]